MDKANRTKARDEASGAATKAAGELSPADRAAIRAGTHPLLIVGTYCKVPFVGLVDARRYDPTGVGVDLLAPIMVGDSQRVSIWLTAAQVHADCKMPGRSA